MTRMRVSHALITGAGRGLGRAIATELCAEGVDVALVDKDDIVHETVAAINSASPEGTGQARAFQGDCSDETEIERIWNEVRDDAGPVDLLVNNVGGSAGTRAKPLGEQDPAVLREVVDRCLVSTILWSRLAIAHLASAGYGKIVSISSDSGFHGDANMSEYSASKAGMIGFTRALARELAPHQVNVNAIAPGPIWTAAQERLPEEVREAGRRAIPLGRYGDPVDIAKTAAFLSSSDADFITGQTIVVDGGRWMH